MDWLKGSVKNKCAPRRRLYIPEGQNIPVLELRAAIDRGGKVAKEARLA